MVIIRPATEEDAPAIAEFNRAMALETENLELDRERVLRGVRALLADSAKGFYIVAETAGRVVGQTMVTYEWSDWRNGTFWWIQSVYVAPEHRGSGIFRLLYQHLRELGEADSEVCGLRLYVEHENERAQRIYAGLGMSPTHYRMMEVDFVIRR